MLTQEFCGSQKYYRWTNQELHERVLQLYSQLECLTLDNFQISKSNEEMVIRIATLADLQPHSLQPLVTKSRVVNEHPQGQPAKTHRSGSKKTKQIVQHCMTPTSEMSESDLQKMLTELAEGQTKLAERVRRIEVGEQLKASLKGVLNEDFKGTAKTIDTRRRVPKRL